MKRWLKRVGLGFLAILVVVLAGGGIYVYSQTSAYDASVEKVYDVKPLLLSRTSDPAAIARGKHLASSIAGCAIKDCHGPDFGAGKVTDGGPIGIMAPPNVSSTLLAYSDGELGRLIRHGLKKDGRTVRFMPVNEFNWLSDADVVALISYLRTVPPVDRPTTAMTIKTLGKVLDRKGLLPIDIASKIDHGHIEQGPASASATAEYGRWIGRMCNGCHGDHMSGGPIPGAPPDFPVPLNLTPHATGLQGWSYEDFVGVVTTGVRKNGKKLAEFMPIEAISNMDDVERKALWAYLQGLPPMPFGQR
jgi:mono/diheme cytochrome c family protein